MMSAWFSKLEISSRRKSYPKKYHGQLDQLPIVFSRKTDAEMLDETDPNITLFFLVEKKKTLRHRAIQINRGCVYRDPSFPILVEIYPDEYNIYRINS
jgi:hypothetical protein